MQVKTFHTIDLEEWQQFTDYFHPRYGSHFITLPSGRILVSVMFASEWAEEHFANNTTTRVSLPHPVFNGNDIISSAHQTELAPLFVGATVAVSAAKVSDVIQLACQIHPLMKLSVF